MLSLLTTISLFTGKCDIRPLVKLNPQKLKAISYLTRHSLSTKKGEKKAATFTITDETGILTSMTLVIQVCRSPALFRKQALIAL